MYDFTFLYNKTCHRTLLITKNIFLAPQNFLSLLRKMPYVLTNAGCRLIYLRYLRIETTKMGIKDIT